MRTDERDAAVVARSERQKETAGGRNVVAWQLGELVVEVLEAEVDVERGRVLLEELEDDRHALGDVTVHHLHAPTLAQDAVRRETEPEREFTTQTEPRRARSHAAFVPVLRVSLSRRRRTS